jgi:N-acetylneuraminate synthase
MDLSSLDVAYRERSISELQRVIDRTRELKAFFPKTARPLIIVNPGGFTSDRFLPVEQRKALYDRIADAFDQVDRDGVEIIPQTMPPLPWHFGGQRFHNLFMEANEIVSFCGTHGVRICLDTSHSKLACNYSGWSLRNFIRLVGPFIAHLHIVDARGHHDEGLQISTGEIDFEALGEDLDTWAPNVSFIPEIWQGHKNGGEGFWLALDRLEQCFGSSQHSGAQVRARAV